LLCGECTHFTHQCMGMVVLSDLALVSWRSMQSLHAVARCPRRAVVRDRFLSLEVAGSLSAKRSTLPLVFCHWWLAETRRREAVSSQGMVNSFGDVGGCLASPRLVQIAGFMPLLNCLCAVGIACKLCSTVDICVPSRLLL
jgi:hypothetical protein